MLLPKRLQDNLFILFAGVIYILSFSGMNVGDLYFRSLENGYPLFLDNTFGRFPLWYGFQKAHLLNMPTLRLIQLTLAKFGLYLSPLVLVQTVNLFLGLASLSLLHSILLRLRIGENIARAATMLFAFSFGFWSNMNGEIHHFSILLLVAALRLLLEIEISPDFSRCRAFVFSACLGLLPLYHLECAIFSGLIILYIFFNRKLKLKFWNRIFPAASGLLILPSALITGSIVFYYLNNYADFGNNGFVHFVSRILPIQMRAKSEQNFALQIFSFQNYNFFDFYIMLRAQLESFSIFSRSIKMLQHYWDIVFYGWRFLTVVSLFVAVLYITLFALISIVILVPIVKYWNNSRHESFAEDSQH